MTFPSHFHVPGAFHADGVHPGLFRPPMSPSSSSDYLSSSAFASASASETAPKRKWSRSDVPRMHDTAPGDGFFSGEPFVDGTPSSRPASRAYALAGQLDTPMDDAAIMGESMFSDSDYRRALGSKRTRDEMDCAPAGPTPLFSLPLRPAPALGWGSFAVATIGGVVGRVWKFCKAGAFRGLYPGDGAKFTLSGPSPNETYYFQGSQSPNSNDYYNFGTQNAPPQLLQGGQYYPDVTDDAVYGSGSSTPTGPAAKRRHTDHFNELGRNWVMIREPGEAEEQKKKTPRRTSATYRSSSRSRNPGLSLVTPGRGIPTPNGMRLSPPIQSPHQSMPDLAAASTPQSPRRPVSHATNRPASRLSDAAAFRPASRLSDAASLRPMSRLSDAAALRPASAASFASFSGTKSPSPSRIPVKAASTASVASPASISTHPAARPPTRRRRSSIVPPAAEPQARHGHGHGHRRTNSAASAASSRGDASPRLTTEAKQLAARRKMEERDTDVRMAAFNKRLQDMIRQGKEALGTTIEIDVTECGWEDDE